MASAESAEWVALKQRGTLAMDLLPGGWTLKPRDRVTRAARWCLVLPLPLSWLFTQATQMSGLAHLSLMRQGTWQVEGACGPETLHGPLNQALLDATFSGVVSTGSLVLITVVLAEILGTTIQRTGGRPSTILSLLHRSTRALFMATVAAAFMIWTVLIGIIPTRWVPPLHSVMWRDQKIPDGGPQCPLNGAAIDLSQSVRDGYLVLTAWCALPALAIALIVTAVATARSRAAVSDAR